jgi:tetratricopeptide (TPR) repeat protein
MGQQLMITALRWISFGIASIAAVSLIATTAPGLAQTPKQWKCTGNDDFPFDQQIMGCTRAINSKKYAGNGIAWAYYSRGVAYYNTGNYDRAIADFSSALDLCKQESCFQFDRYVVYFFRGLAWGEKDDFDRGIADYTEAIRLNPKYRLAYHNRGDLNMAKYWTTYRNRGDINMVKFNYEQAIADFSEAIKLAPDADTYKSRGEMYLGKGDFNNAVADFTEAIARDPKDVDEYYYRGISNLYAGYLPKARADFERVMTLAPSAAYGSLWLEIIAKRSNVLSQLSQAKSQLNMGAWPGPIVRLFGGELTAEALDASTDSTNTDQVCDANFFIGEFKLLAGEKEEAAKRFRLAVPGCRIPVMPAATAELKALGGQ